MRSANVEGTKASRVSAVAEGREEEGLLMREVQARPLCFFVVGSGAELWCGCCEVGEEVLRST